MGSDGSRTDLGLPSCPDETIAEMASLRLLARPGDTRIAAVQAAASLGGHVLTVAPGSGSNVFGTASLELQTADGTSLTSFGAVIKFLGEPAPWLP